MEKERFVVSVSEETLTNLHQRLAQTRWPDEAGNTNWEYGTKLADLKELVTYWQTSYDWRQFEQKFWALVKSSDIFDFSGGLEGMVPKERGERGV